MRFRNFLLTTAIFTAPLLATGQAAPPAPAGPPCPGMPGLHDTHGGMTVMYHREMGKWWQNSETVKKLQLNENQISQLDQTFLEHRMRLVEDGAQMEKQDLKLQSLLDADVPNEGQINMQVDEVLAARGKLEREHTMMNLELRKVLSLEQWRQLKSMHGNMGDRMFFRKLIPPGSAPTVIPLPPGAASMAPLPPPRAEEMF